MTYRNAQAVTRVLVLFLLVFGMPKGLLSGLEVRLPLSYVLFKGADASLSSSSVLARLLQPNGSFMDNTFNAARLVEVTGDIVAGLSEPIRGCLRGGLKTLHPKVE